MMRRGLAQVCHTPRDLSRLEGPFFLRPHLDERNFGTDDVLRTALRDGLPQSLEALRYASSDKRASSPSRRCAMPSAAPSATG